MKLVSENDIYFSPSLEIENKENKNGLTFSAVGEPEKFEFYIFYKRPKKVSRLFGLIHYLNENYLTDITGQTEKDALHCLQALLNNDLAFLEEKIR